MAGGHTQITAHAETMPKNTTKDNWSDSLVEKTKQNIYCQRF